MFKRILSVMTIGFALIGLQACSSPSSNSAALNAQPEGNRFLVIKESPHSPEATLSQVARLIASHGGLILEQVDQPSQRVNQAGYIAPTHILVFKIEAGEITAQPQRIMAWADGQTTYLVYTLQHADPQDHPGEARLESITDEVISG